MTRALTPAERKEAARLEAQLHREGLARAEFNHPIARKQVFRADGIAEHTEEYLAQARDFLEAHSFDSDMDEAIWKLHARGVSRKKIAVHLKAQGAYRKLVDNRVKALKKLMHGRLSTPRRKRGGQPNLSGYHRKCTRVVIRLNEAQELALRDLERALAKRYKNRASLIRAVLMEVARASIGTEIRG